MYKKVITLLILSAIILTGCGLAERFEQAKTTYLDKRVEEMLEEMPAGEAVVEEPASEETVEEVAEEPEPEATEEPAPPESEPEVEETEEVEEEETPEVEETEEPEEEPTPEPTVESNDPAVYLGDPTWVDTMETGEFWTTSAGELTSAVFEEETLKIVALSDITGWRIASQPVLKNAYIEAEVAMGSCSGTDSSGLIFRVPNHTGYNQGYLFGVTCDGKYRLRKWDGLKGETGQMLTLHPFTASGFINIGEGASNRVGIMTLDDRLGMIVNGEMVAEGSDDTYEQGFFGMFINRDNTEELTIHVDNVKFWVDPQEK